MGSYGTCKVLRSCKWAMDGYQRSKFRLEELTRCGWKGTEVIICCLDERSSGTSTEPETDFM